MNALQKQTARELKEGSRQNKIHARADAAELRAAKKKGMSRSQYILWKFERNEARRKKKPARKTAAKPPANWPEGGIDPNVKIPIQARRAALVANALLERDKNPNSHVLKLLRLKDIMLEADRLVDSLI